METLDWGMEYLERREQENKDRSIVQWMLGILQRGQPASIFADATGPAHTLHSLEELKHCPCRLCTLAVQTLSGRAVTVKTLEQWHELKRTQQVCSYCAKTRLCAGVPPRWHLCEKCWGWGLEAFDPRQRREIETHMLKVGIAQTGTVSTS